MRLFFVINFSTETKSSLIALQDELRSKVISGNFPLPENLHLTLAFLGECNTQQTAAAKAALDEISFEPLEVMIERVGRFRRDNGDIWWAGIQGNPELLTLQRDLTKRLIEKGFTLESRKYSPHITLGREVITECQPWKIEPFGETVGRVDLMKSERINGRLRYAAIHRRGKWLSPINVVPYDANWAAGFERIKAFLMPHISDLIVGIHHVGSTSVPGLAAKPIIDFDIEICDMSVFQKLEKRLSGLGYHHEGDLGITGREAFKRSVSDDFISYHMYVCPSDSAELQRHLLFRDYLCSNSTAVKEYGELKISLAEICDNDIDSYIDGKAGFIMSCLKKQ